MEKRFTVSSYQVEQTKELLLKVWTVLLMGLYGVGFFQEKMLVEQVVESTKEVLPDIAKLLFFALMFVSFLIDIVEMRENKDKAYRFLLLSLILGGLSATFSAMQYHALTSVMGGRAGRESSPLSSLSFSWKREAFHFNFLSGSV